MKPYISKLQYLRVTSEILEIIAGPIELDVDPSFVHSFAGLIFLDSPDLITKVQPSAGEATLTVQTAVQPHVFQAVPGNVLSVDTPDQFDWASNTEKVRVTESDTIVGATHWQLIWCGNSA